MNVNPDLPIDPKFAAFKKALGDPAALEYLIRLWGHCQKERRGENWGRKSAEYVEAHCGWTGEQGKLFAALKKQFCDGPGFICTGPRGGIVVTGWNELNSGLISKWENGDKGGRPRTQTGHKPDDNRRLTGHKPTGNLTGQDRTGQDGSGCTEALPPNAPDFPEAEIPSLAEVVAECSLRGIPGETGRAFFEHYEKTALPRWTDAGGKHFQWRGKLRSWSVRDRAAGAGQKNGVGAISAVEKNRAQLEAELDSEQDPDKRRDLRDQIKVLAHGQGGSR